MKPITGVICTIIGAGIGFGVGYTLGKKKQIKKSDQDLAEMDKYYKEKYGLTDSDKKRKKIVEAKPEAVKTDEKPAAGAMKLTAEKFRTFDQITPVKAPIEEYAKKYHSTIERKEDDDPAKNILPVEEMAEIIDEQRMAGEYQCMAIITPEEWETDEEYDKNEVTYWEEDECFSDSDGTQIPFEILSPDRVGRANLEKFGITGDDGILYVRDDANQEDFKIYLEEGSYAGGEA